MERRTSSNGELAVFAPGCIHEAFDLDPELVKAIDFVSKVEHDSVIAEVFNKPPSSDVDKNGWLFLLGSSYLGYAIQQKMIDDREVSENGFVNAVQSQLGSDDKRWGDTWKQRPIEGQLARTYARFKDYKDQYENGGQEFPWLKVAGGIIINLYRVDNPDYQK